MCTTPNRVAASGTVVSVTNIQDAVYSVTVRLPNGALPKEGQFFLIRAKPSAVFLARPISVYRVCKAQDGTPCAEFLILQKGRGTQELCHAPLGLHVDLVGPLGNTFPRPESLMQNGTLSACTDATAHGREPKPCAVIGGGIGVAPVAFFASSLEPNSYDFYACFKSGSYGLQHVEPRRLLLSTDDGSCGTKGMLPDIFSHKEAAQYACVYACGPEPMLRYVQAECAKKGTPCYISLESRMACGVGACLGCTIRTVHGNRRCCTDGPVFDARDIIFGEKA